MLTVMLKQAGYTVDLAADGQSGLELLEQSRFDFVLCDIKMPKMDGMTFLKEAIQSHPEKTYIMMSAYGSVENALQAMKEGAYDYISKPFKADEVLLTLKKAEERERLKSENLQLKSRIHEIEKKYSFENIIARSEAMAKVFALVSKVAEHKTTVLITGESGTGKELIAKAIHSRSTRSKGPLVSINCGGIPENLLESELFGYKKGAFTGADRDKPGRFEEADGGTIFLDEIGELPLTLQVKMLRVLQEEEVSPLGGVGVRKVDARVVAATSRNMDEEVQKGNFREDLYYRINVMTLHMPALRERRGDIPLLVGYFIDVYNKKLNKNIEGLSSETMPLLMGYSWPGNVRELENVIERAILLNSGRWITPEDLPPNIVLAKIPSANPKYAETLSIKKASKMLEKDLIEKVLELTNGNRSQASKILEISRPILIAKIKEYEIDL